MVTTVRLDEKTENELNQLVNTLHKKKSEIIREAIYFYAKNIKETKEERMRKAIVKSKDADFRLYKEFEDILDESLQR
ncbi:MAG TPA: ribbon-helix-helix protein, CopG family [Campylobacteraceae bacterium]|jgi:predicted transcriptional regulator|nr:ribbon-helix-helix protein, CopG family [Campylobacteraceae bacterium]HHD83886.1 ribbon-helix-helix protein, CopG family [Campylobacteraceae bacterium]